MRPPERLRRLVTAPALLVAGAAAGWALDWTTVGAGGAHAGGEGPTSWRASTRIGASLTDPLTRAVVARTSIWALPSREMRYFSAERDADGRALSRCCVYEIAGRGDRPPRWWSVGLYRDDRWVDNAGDRYAFSRTTVTRDPQGGWRILAAGAPQAGDWLPMGAKDGVFLLLFRLYQPAPTVAADLRAAPLPLIRRLACA